MTSRCRPDPDNTAARTDSAHPSECTAPVDFRVSQILHTWFSPAYPVGAFSYSHGLEWAVENRQVQDRNGLELWVSDLIEFGAGLSDAILLAEAWRRPDPGPVAILAEALCPTAERHLETMAQGAAFAKTTAAVRDIPMEPLAYPVAVGHAARLLDLPLEPVLTFFLQAFAANIVSAGVRLVPLGQTDGQRVTASLLPLCQRTAALAGSLTPEDIGGVAQHADIASMFHETQYTRLYRS